MFFRIKQTDCGRDITATIPFAARVGRRNNGGIHHRYGASAAILMRPAEPFDQGSLAFRAPIAYRTTVCFCETGVLGELRTGPDELWRYPLWFAKTLADFEILVPLAEP